MTKLPDNIEHLNLSNKEFEALSNSEKERIMSELPCNDATFFSEIDTKADIDLTKLPCVVDGVILY